MPKIIKNKVSKKTDVSKGEKENIKLLYTEVQFLDTVKVKTKLPTGGSISADPLLNFLSGRTAMLKKELEVVAEAVPDKVSSFSFEKISGLFNEIAEIFHFGILNVVSSFKA